MRIQIFVEHDIIIRHFLHSGVFRLLETRHEVQYVFPEKTKRIRTDIASLGLSNYKRIDIDEHRAAKLRHLAKIQTLHRTRHKEIYHTVQDTWKMMGDDVFRGMWLRSQPVIFPIYRRKTLKQAGQCPSIERAIDDFAPHLIIHPSVLEGLFIADLALACPQRSIPFLVLMNSWDNPSTKSMVVNYPDVLAVWGKQTQRHAIDFMGIPEAKTRILGAAQFDVYRKKPTTTKRELCQTLGIDPSMRLMVYAGSSKSVNEIKHLQLLEQAIENRDLQNCFVIFRPHPWRAPAPGEPDFFDIPWRHVEMDPAMRPSYNSPKSAAPTQINLTDYMDTHNLLSVSDCLISNVSTILLEAALHGNAIACMVSDEEINTNRFLRVVHNAVYFKELIQTLRVPRVRLHSQLATVCQDLLKKAESPQFRQEQRAKTEYFIDRSDISYEQRLTNLAEQMTYRETVTN